VHDPICRLPAAFQTCRTSVQFFLVLPNPFYGAYLVFRVPQAPRALSFCIKASNMCFFQYLFLNRCSIEQIFPSTSAFLRMLSLKEGIPSNVSSRKPAALIRSTIFSFPAPRSRAVTFQVPSQLPAVSPSDPLDFLRNFQRSCASFITFSPPAKCIALP